MALLDDEPQTAPDYWSWGHSELIERIERLENHVIEADILLEPRTDVHADYWREQLDKDNIIRR